MLVHLDLVQVQVNTCSHMHGTIREEASWALSTAQERLGAISKPGCG